jgi:DNA-binding Lrp family transcriptional regulator
MKILKMLNENARTSFSEMGREVGLSTSGVRKRIKQLEKSGVIRGYTTLVNPQKFDRGLTAFISVNVDIGGIRDLTRSLSRCREVCELHRTTGYHSLMIKVRVRDLERLNKFVENRISSFDAVKSVRTTVSMETIKETPMNL